MNRRQVLPGLGAALMLAGCASPTYAFRFKLSLAVEVDGQMKRGFSVVDLEEYAGSFERMVHTRNYSEAIYLELGAPHTPLVALLTYSTDANTFPYGMVALLRAYAAPSRWDWDRLRNDELDKLQRRRGVREISLGSLKLGDLPDFITFDDPLRPASVRRVDPTHLAATYGNGVRLAQATIEIVDTAGWLSFGGGIPRTSGIEQKLPWLDAYRNKMLDGRGPGQAGDRSSPTHRLNSGSFRSRS